MTFSEWNLLPDGVSGCSWGRGGRRGEAAVSVEIFYGPTPGRVDGWDLASGLGLLAVEPERAKREKRAERAERAEKPVGQIKPQCDVLSKSVCQQTNSTHVTAYCANDKYSTRTSRPRFSSLRNSLTHLQKKSWGTIKTTPTTTTTTARTAVRGWSFEQEDELDNRSVSVSLATSGTRSRTHFSICPWAFCPLWLEISCTGAPESLKRLVVGTNWSTGEMSESPWSDVWATV